MAVAVETKTIPEISDKSFFGNWRAVRRDPLGFFSRVVAECGDIGSYRSGTFPVIMLNSPELVHSLLVEHADDYDKGFFQRYAFRPLAGNGLLTSEGKLHQVQRKLMAPTFQPRNLVNYADTIVEYSDRNQAQWAEGQEVDLEQEMMALTMSIISKVMLGAEIRSEKDDLGKAFVTGVEWIQHAMTQFTPPLWFPTPRNLRTRRAIAVLKQRLMPLIQERKQNIENKGDLLSLLVNARYEDGNPMSDRQIYDETLTIFGAGHGTTALALTWAFYLLMQHPEIYDRLQAEVTAVLDDKLPTYSDLPNLPYASQVFKEAMRLYPPSSVILRTALKDTELRGYPVRKGQIVSFSQYTMHRRPDYFPNPEKFDPDRFSPENEQKLPRNAYLPFGAGHRICIGNHFALMEGPLILATLAQKVRFELVRGQKIEPELVVNLHPKYGLKARVQRL